MLNVAFISADHAGPDRQGGACWHRCTLPAEAVTAHSSDTHATVAPGYSIQHPSRRIWPIGWDYKPVMPPDGGTWHIIVLQRIMFADTADKIRAARQTGQIIINDLDDWYWGLATSNAAFAGTHPRANPDEHRGHYWSALAASSHITVSTSYLADRIARLDVPTTVIANTLPDSMFLEQPVRDRPPIIGWVGATGYRSGDLEQLRGIIGPWIERHNLTFVHGGHTDRSPTAANLLGINPDRATTRPLTTTSNYPQLWDGIDIAIAPLTDRPFNHAKSWIKAGEASAAGAPAVCTDITPYREWQASPLARRPRDWTRQLTALLDPAERQAVRTRQLARADQHRTSRRWTDWHHLWHTLAAGR